MCVGVWVCEFVSWEEMGTHRDGDTQMVPDSDQDAVFL